MSEPFNIEVSRVIDLRSRPMVHLWLYRDGMTLEFDLLEHTAQRLAWLLSHAPEAIEKVWLEQESEAARNDYE